MGNRNEPRDWRVLFDEAAAEYYTARRTVYRNALAGRATDSEKTRMILAAVRIADLMVDDSEVNDEIRQEEG